MNLAVVAPPLGVVIAAAISASTIWFAKRSDSHADRAASIESPSGMAGVIIAGWQDMVKEKNVSLAAAEERERQLRVDLDTCIERARRARRARSDH